MTPEEFTIARDSAVRTINRLVDNDFHMRGPNWVETWCDLSLDWSDGDPAYVVLPEYSIPKLFERATENAEIFSLATYVIGTRLACDAPLTDAMRIFASEFLKGNLKSPLGKAGRPIKNTWGRDFIIIEVVSRLAESSGLPIVQNPERNPKKRHETTVSEIIAAAVQLSQLHNHTRGQIEKIWHRRDVQGRHRETYILEGLRLLDDANDIKRV
jgi:hypothetical protein